LRSDLAPPGAQPPATRDPRQLDAWLEEVVAVSSEAAPAALSFESEYVRVAREELPFHELIPPEAVNGANAASLQWVHSHGAVECLADALRLLQADGHFIVMDYSYEGARPDPIEFQTFGSSVAAGVNFPQLLAYARSRTDCLVGVPPEDPVSLQARLFARDRAAAEVVQLFQSLYGKEAAEQAEAPYREAHELASSGRHEAARWKFEEAYRLQPYNWYLMEGIVSFLTYSLEEHEAALEICKRALQLNHLSPRAWNLLGDCHYALAEFDAAEQAYRQATRINPREVRGRTNLAYVFLRRGAIGEALRIIGEALALDRAGECREELLSKQSEALQALASEHLRDMRNGIERLSGQHALPGR
jgi:tetratricopeptide (TPR) repeat protein